MPEALRSVVGKRELLEPLGGDRRAALRKLPAAVARMQVTLDDARERVKRPARVGRPLSARQMARAHFDEQVGLDEDFRNTSEAYALVGIDDVYVAALRRAIAGTASNGELGETVGWIVQKFQAKAHTGVVENTAEWRALARTLAIAELEHVRIAAARDEGDFTAKPEHPLLLDEPDQASAAIRARKIGPNSTKSLSEIVSAFANEKGAKSATTYEYETAVRMFEEHLGEARPVYKITRPDVIGFKDALLKTPANYTKRFPDTKLPHAISQNEARKAPFPTLNITTINDKWLPRLHSILRWCVDNAIIPDNPASGVKVSQKKGGHGPSRVPFTPGDLTRIFSPPKFEKDKLTTERQWALLIALFSGMRASEIAQMKLDSVRHERQILALAIEEETKNGQSLRVVPVHSKLIALGLPERIERLRKNGETHLFPEWYRQGRDQLARAKAAGKIEKQPYSQFIPRWFLRTYKKQVGIDDARKKFHSFRHTLKTALSRAGVPRSISDDITGHDDSSSGATYIHDSAVEAMKDALEKVHFDGFPL